MTPRLHIRPAQGHDAADLAVLIRITLRISNGADYPPAVLAPVIANFTAARLREMIRTRQVLTARHRRQLIGTASLEGGTIRTVFVHPDSQGLGVGRHLMARLEDLARRQGIGVLRVPASVTAEGFYAQLGYHPLREALHGEERTIIMEKALQN